MATTHCWVYSISSLYIFAGMIMAKATKSIQLIRHLNINNCASRRQPQREQMGRQYHAPKRVIFRDVTLCFCYTGLNIYGNENCRIQYWAGYLSGGLLDRNSVDILSYSATAHCCFT